MKERKNWTIKEQAQDWVVRETVLGGDPASSPHHRIGLVCRCGDCFCCEVVQAAKDLKDGKLPKEVFQ